MTVIDKHLFVQAIGKFLLGVVIIGLLLFLSAGSLQYWQGGVLVGGFFLSMFCAGGVVLGRGGEVGCGVFFCGRCSAPGW